MRQKRREYIESKRLGLTLTDLVVGDRLVAGLCDIIASKDALDFRLGSDNGVVLLELVGVAHLDFEEVGLSRVAVGTECWKS